MYRVVKTPVNYIKGVKPHLGRVKEFKKPTTDMKGTKPYLGRLKNRVCYGIVYGCELRIWMLNESGGHIEWLLKYEINIGLPSDHERSLNGRELHGSWKVEEGDSDDESSDIILPDMGTEWDSDNDDTFTLEVGSKESCGRIDILGFHPSKKVVFLSNLFCVEAYHLDSSKSQYLGYSRPSPQCYYLSCTNGIYESFVYTPCMIGDLLQGDCNR